MGGSGMYDCTLSSLCVMVILPGCAKWLPVWDSASEVRDAVPASFQCYAEVPVQGGFPVLGGWLVQLLSACKPEPDSEEGFPAKVPVASEAKCLCAVLLCKNTWEANPNSEDVPGNKVTS